MIRLSPLALVAALALASCDRPASEQAAASDAPASIATGAPEDRAATLAHEAMGVRATMALSSDGFAYRVAGGTRGERTGFGVERASVERIARQQFGEPDERGENAECGAGPIQFSTYGPLRFNFQDGRLVGWFLDEGGRIATVDGVMPGVTAFADLEAEREAWMIPDSTLEGEFRYAAADGGEIGGFVRKDGVVTSLHAGTNCFYR